MAAVSVAGFLWTYAFFQNGSVFGGRRADDGIRATLRAAWGQATLRPSQIWLSGFILLLLALFVLINLRLAILLPAELARIFLGIESVFTRGGFSTMNSTFLTILLALTFLCVDPVTKAFHTLRCFYGQSLRTGQDLRAELSQAVRSAKATGVAGLVLVGVLAVSASPASAATGGEAAGTGGGQPRAAPTTTGQVAPKQLRQSIRRVIARREYTWRVPREKDSASSSGRSFLQAIADKIRFYWRQIIEERKRNQARKAEQRDAEQGSRDGGPGWGDRSTDLPLFGWVDAVKVILGVLVVVVVAALAVLLWRVVRKRRSAAVAQADETAVARPDLEDEDVTAEDLPEAGWMDMARRLIDEGDLRLALRAMFLASLAHLADARLVTIARFKSNHDYQRELARRAHALPNVLGAFAQNVGSFEDAWYGMHAVSPATVRRFAANQERIQQLAQA